MFDESHSNRWSGAIVVFVDVSLTASYIDLPDRNFKMESAIMNDLVPTDIVSRQKDRKDHAIGGISGGGASDLFCINSITLAALFARLPFGQTRRRQLYLHVSARL